MAPAGIIINSGRFHFPKVTMFAALKVAYSESIYINPKITMENHLYFPQKSFFPINREMIKIVTGSNIHKYIILYPIASDPLVKNQNAMREIPQIAR